ncbi:MAG: MarR family transcriptional regulator [Sphaerisporangium sp.]|jgi:deoxyribonucleoside regulator|nr:MarR family transcriptional regulator [Sphaerisporangium sp.]
MLKEVTTSGYDARLMSKAATLYHLTGLTQVEVAQRLGISRQLAGRLLREALRRGIVHIEIRPPKPEVNRLEPELEERYGLAEAVVVTAASDAEAVVNRAIGRGAAELVARRVPEGGVLGLSWSTTVYETVQALTPQTQQRATVVQLDGGANAGGHHTHAEQIITLAANAFGGPGRTLVVPLYVEREEIASGLLADSGVAGTVALARQADVMVFGIGPVSAATSLYRAGYLSDQTLGELAEAGAVGDVCGRFFDAEGRECLEALSRRTLAVGFDDLRSCPFSIAVAGGAQKIDAIHGALRAGLCDSLVTDQATAEELLRRATDIPTRQARPRAASSGTQERTTP